MRQRVRLERPPCPKLEPARVNLRTDMSRNRSRGRAS